MNFRYENKNSILVWKPHIAKHFLENDQLRYNNGVGIGGSVFLDFHYMKSILAEDDYFVIPILMRKKDLHIINKNIAESLVNCKGIKKFNSIYDWEKDLILLMNIVNKTDNI